MKAETKLTKSVVVPVTAPPRPNTNQAEYTDNTFEVRVHNFKDKVAVEVIVEVLVPSDQQSVAPLTRVNATSATGTVQVPSGKDGTLSYTLRTRTR